MPLEVQQVVENISFDPNTLAISHTMQVTVDNFQGITSLYQTYGLRGYGNMGIAMRMGWDHMPNGPDGGIGWQHFYGFINEYLYQRGAGGDSKLVLNCVDQMQQMADVLIAAPTDLDGWNHYSAMAYLWMYGGVTPAQLAFAGLVPTIDGGTLLSDPSGSIDPFGVSPDDPTPGGYFLPYGQGMHPWTPRDRTLPVLSLMEFVRKTTGYLNYIDAQGYARYEQWIPPSAGVTKKVYDEYAYDGYGQPGGEVNELFGMTARIGTANTRNRTILIGIDAFGPEWAPIVESRQDDASIFTDPSVTPPQNYIGYEKAFIWLDARFANEEYASAAADFIFAINRLPDYDVTCQAWLQPEIFPLDTIMVNDWRSNSAGIPFYVMSVQNTLSVLSGNLVLTTTLTGKFLI